MLYHRRLRSCYLFRYLIFLSIHLLGAAINLHDNNITNFLVLEANNRIGGRVHSQQFAGETISLGAGWIHSSNLNHGMYQLANKYNLTLYKDSNSISDVIFR